MEPLPSAELDQKEPMEAAAVVRCCYYPSGRPEVAEVYVSVLAPLGVQDYECLSAPVADSYLDPEEDPEVAMEQPLA